MGGPGELIHVSILTTQDMVLIIMSISKVITFEKASGWIQWTWKAEQADEWSYSAGLLYGWIPQDPTDLMYPNICG